MLWFKEAGGICPSFLFRLSLSALCPADESGLSLFIHPYASRPHTLISLSAFPKALPKKSNFEMYISCIYWHFFGLFCHLWHDAAILVPLPDQTQHSDTGASKIKTNPIVAHEYRLSGLLEISTWLPFHGKCSSGHEHSPGSSTKTSAYNVLKMLCNTCCDGLGS